METAYIIMDVYNLGSATTGGKLEGYGQWEGRFSTTKIATSMVKIWTIDKNSASEYEILNFVFVEGESIITLCLW